MPQQVSQLCCSVVQHPQQKNVTNADTSVVQGVHAVYANRRCMLCQSGGYLQAREQAFT